MYYFALGLYSEAVYSALLTGEHRETDLYYQKVIKNARDIYDAIGVYEAKISSLNSQAKYEKALNLAFDVLKKLNFPIPKKPTNSQMVLGVIKIKPFLSPGRIDALMNLKKIKDKHILTVIRLLGVLADSAYFSDRKLFGYVVLKEAELAMKYGYHGFMNLAVMLHFGMGDTEGAYRLGKLALKLGEKLDDRKKEAKRYFFFYWMISHWKEHIKYTKLGLKKTYQLAMETGNLDIACHSLALCDVLDLFLGCELSALEKKIVETYQVLKHYKHTASLLIHCIKWQMVLNLLGKSESPLALSGTAFRAEQVVPGWEASEEGDFLIVVYGTQIFIHYLFYDYRGSYENCQKALKLFDEIGMLLPFRESYLYYALTLLVLYRQSDKKTKVYFRKVLNKVIRFFKKWTALCPENNEHRLSLILAEKARVTGKQKQAEFFYNKAVDLSLKNEHPVDWAVANELAFKYYLERGNQKLARIHFYDAHNGYSRWGATAKVEHLKKSYPEFSANFFSGPKPGRDGSVIDLYTVMKASQAISGEIVLENLLARMMKIVMQNAGAVRGLLIMNDDGQLFIEAEGTIDGEVVSTNEPISIDEYPGLPSSIIYYTARSRKSILLKNASLEGDYIDDPYVIQHKPRSVLCTALMNRNRLSGILYLENNLTSGSFTPDRLELINLLSSQIAVSIDNARLYANLEEKVRERTGKLLTSNNELKKARDALWGEMQLARKLQASLLPVNPCISGYDIAAYMETTDLMGGDYYDVINVAGRNWVVIGDVSGHGVSAGFVMMMV